MSDTRVLGILGLDPVSSVIAARAGAAGHRLVVAAEGTSPAPQPGLGSAEFVADLAGLVEALPPPRRLLARWSGRDRESSLIAALEPGDLLISCGDRPPASYAETAERCAGRGLGFLEVGVAALGRTAEAALLGVGGRPEDWAAAKGLLGERNVALVGGPGSGAASTLAREALEGLRFELLAEVYGGLRAALRASYDEMRTVFAHWNSGELADPLLGATADALGLLDEDGEPLLELVLDVSMACGPCARAAALALDAGIPAPMTAQAAFAQAIAARKDERIDASALLGGPSAAPSGERHAMIEELRKTLYGSLALAAAESLNLLGRLAERWGCRLDLARVARFWAESGGSAIMARAAEALARDGSRRPVVLDAAFKRQLDLAMPSLRRVASKAVDVGQPAPALAAAVSAYDSLRSTRLPANLVAALEDSLRGSGFQRVDRPRGEVFHSEWR